MANAERCHYLTVSKLVPLHLGKKLACRYFVETNGFLNIAASGKSHPLFSTNPSA